MSNSPWDQQEESKLAYYLVNRVHDKASGRSASECLHNYPRDVYFIGNLRPQTNELSEQEERVGFSREMQNKLAPIAFGAEFLLHPENEFVKINVTVTWACYYRIFPTFSQQCEHQRQHVLGINGSSENIPRSEQRRFDVEANNEIENEQSVEEDASEIFETTHDRRQSRKSLDSLFIRFRKIDCSATGHIVLQLNRDKHWAVNDTELQTALSNGILRARQVALSDIEHIRTAGTSESKVRVPDNALVSQEAYSSFLETLQNHVEPEWRWELLCNLIPTGCQSECIFSVELANVSPNLNNSPNTDPFLFDTQVSFTFPGNIVKPFELDLAPRGFRYNRYVWGRGINCAITIPINEQKALSTFITTHMPIYEQLRFSTRSEPHARFIDLAKNPIPTLEAILKAMESYRQVWEAKRQCYVKDDTNWEAEFGAEFEKDRLGFIEEIERFQSGLQLIQTMPDVRSAFELTNETFSRTEKTEWRLFQIVFLISQIPGIVALSNPTSPGVSDREKVDIIYFPTGGGKTEAYLATIVFHCFYDRLRGKKAGVTAWTRFPLRLLTLQQTQRVADIIGLAELVRVGQPDERLSGRDVDGFAVGYFVGQGGSPNEIVNPNNYTYATVEDQITWSKANDVNMRQAWKRVVRCPSCRTTSVSVDFDISTNSLIHRCSNPDCCFPQGKLPIYIVDNDIYRYLPCVIVGTIDKLAGIGNQRKFAILFGQVDGRCSLHGYYKARCCQKDCFDTSKLHVGIPDGLSGPTLFVQDELHLLKEGLGTFDGHYETFTQVLLREFNQDQSLKIIASSATIEAFERQINHLYGRNPNQARVFPGLGPTLTQSFYAETLPIPARLYVGVIPHNKTIFNTMLEMIEFYHREIQKLQQLSFGMPNPYNGQLLPGSHEWRQLLDFYATSLTYFLGSKELNSLQTDLEGDVNPNLQRDGFYSLRISELTGSTSTDDVSRILERLEYPSSSEALQDAILATSMVSHGVDVDRFNSMFFYGMPRQNAEYIQASSRVGRSHVGIVFNCLHPIRERDQSHYSYFVKFHEFLGQLVEPVAINRWSRFSINRTLPGLFMGVLLQIIATRSGESNPNRYYMIDFVRKKVSEGSLRPEHFIPFLEAAYGVQNPITQGEIVFRSEINRCVRQYLDWIISSTSGLTFISDILFPRPMTSLRDVDEAIPIELDALGTQWAAHTNGL